MTSEWWLDFVLRALLVLGLPTIIIFWFKDRRRIKNDAKKQEQQLPLEVRATAATTMDAEVLALTKAFQTARDTLDRTIADQARMIAAQAAELEAKYLEIEGLRKRVRELQDKLELMRRQMDALQDDFAEVTLQLSQMQNHTDGS
jgi:chromosome segregation ATPase